jgi:hypothetical protein
MTFISEIYEAPVSEYFVSEGPVTQPPTLHLLVSVIELINGHYDKQRLSKIFPLDSSTTILFGVIL